MVAFCLQTLRSLLEMSLSDADKLKLFQEAKQLLAGIGDAYPDREMQWLVTTCWNRGAHQAKFRRLETAEQYMCLALALLESCWSLSERKQVGAVRHALMTLAGGLSHVPSPADSASLHDGMYSHCSYVAAFHAKTDICQSLDFVLLLD